MAGTRAGGLKAAKTNRLLYGDGIKGESFYSKIGRKGGKISRGGAFQKDRAFASAMGKLGGQASRRPSVKK